MLCHSFFRPSDLHPHTLHIRARVKMSCKEQAIGNQACQRLAHFDTLCCLDERHD